MSISTEFIEALNAAAWIGKTLSVAPAYSPADAWDDTYGYADVAPFLIADGTSGMTWQTIEPIEGDFTITGTGITSREYELLFGLDPDAATVNMTHIVVLEPIAGPSWRLVSWQPLESSGGSVAVPPGQIVQVSVRLGHGR